MLEQIESRTPSARVADPGNLARGLAVQIRCVSAIVVRDIMMRYGRNNIGFLWFILEPMILCILVMALFSVIEPKGSQRNLTVVQFYFTGYMPLTLWRHMSTCCIKPSRQSAGLLWHRNISLLDTLIGRLVMEFLGTTAAVMVIYLALLTAGLVQPPAYPGLVMVGWLEMAFLSLAVAVLIAGLTEWSETAERFIQPVQYIMMPISGYLFMVDWLPTPLQRIALWHPLVSIFEMYRGGFFGENLKTYYYLWYPPLCSLIILTYGLWLLERMRDKMHFS
jgi:capsular polysaccharide transport system permease protein